MFWKLLKYLGLVALSAVPRAAQAEWHEATTPHFVVYSEGSAETVRAFATNLERFDKGMRLIHGIPDQDLGPANRLTVYVVDDVGTVRRLGRLRARTGVAGFYVPKASGSVAVTPRRFGTGGTFDLSPTTVLLHEYSHHFMLQNFAAAYPAWYREGFAEFNSTARFEKDGSVGFGAPATHRAVGLVGRKPLSIELLFDLGGRKLSPEEYEATIYGRGWLLTHFLTFEPGREGQLAVYLNALNRGTSSLEAARKAFGDLRQLDEELREYAVRPNLRYARLAPDRVPIGQVAVRMLRPGEVAIMDARMRSRLGVTKDEAPQVAREMRSAATRHLNDPAVQVALAEAEFDAGNLAEAEAAADRALAADPKLGDALLYKAMVKQEQVETSSGSDVEAWKEVRRRFAAANRADPNDPEPLILFYRSFLSQGIAPTPNSVEGLLHAFALAPHDPELRIMVARQHLIDGKAAPARAALAPIAFDPHGGKMAQAAAALIARLDETGAKGALQAFDAAIKEASADEAS